MNPEVTIIIPTFNRAKLLKETLNSVIAQQFVAWECLVIDDGSTDGTEKEVAAFAEEDSRIQYYKRPAERQKGANACRNYGLEIAKGNYIQWFDSDDLMHTDLLAAQVAAIKKTTAPFSVCRIAIFEDEYIAERLIERKQPIRTENLFSDFIMGKVYIVTASTLWDVSIVKASGYRFDEELKAAQEWHFQAQLFFGNNTYTTVDRVLVFKREHQASITYNSERMALFNYVKARVKIYDHFRISLPEEVSSFFEKYFLDHLKEFLRKGWYFEATYIRKAYYEKDAKFSFLDTLKIHMAIKSFRWFSKGEMFLKQLSLNE